MIPELEQERVHAEAERSDAQARLQEVAQARQQVDQLEQGAPVEARRPGGFLSGLLRFTVSVAKVVMESVLPPHLQSGLREAGRAYQDLREHRWGEGIGDLLAGSADVIAKNDANAARDLAFGAQVVQGTMREEEARALTVRGFRQSVVAGIAGAAISVYGRRGGTVAGDTTPTIQTTTGDEAVPATETVTAEGVLASGAPSVPDDPREVPVALDEREPLRDDDEVAIQATFSFEQVQAIKARFEAEQSALEMRLRIAEHRLAEIEQRLSEWSPDADADREDDDRLPTHDRDAHDDRHDHAHVVSVDQLHQSGVPAQDLAGVHSLEDLLHGGYTLEELLDSDWPLEELVHDGGFTPGQLAEAGVPVDVLVQHFEARELVAAVPLEQLQEGGVTAAELLDAGCSVADLAAAGYTLPDLLSAHALLADLAVHFTPAELAAEMPMGEDEATEHRDEADNASDHWDEHDRDWPA